jgi:hydrogenase small subunit
MKARVINRRDFLRLSSMAAAAVGVAHAGFSQRLFAASKKPAVIWLSGQDCTGCTESVLASLTPSLPDVLLNTLDVHYQETIMAGTGSVSDAVLQAAINEKGYVLIMEGSMPAADKRFLQVGGKAVEDTFVAAAINAKAVIAIGACAAFGGIPKLGPTNGQPASYFLSKNNVTTPLINLPGCPVNPVWFFDTVTNFLAGNTITLDSNKRPTAHFGSIIHNGCPRYNTSNCLLPMGCKGPSTYTDCRNVQWNDKVNYCLGTANSPCAGCTEPDFCSSQLYN